MQTHRTTHEMLTPAESFERQWQALGSLATHQIPRILSSIESSAYIIESSLKIHHVDEIWVIKFWQF